MVDKIEIDDEIYDIVDEELNNIEYLEILSIDEIIKDNPSFMALSKDEIQSELYKTFKNKNKTDNFTKLFYDVINNNKIREGILDDYSNYIFMSDVDKKDFSELNIEEEVANYNELDKLQTTRYNISKNNYFFAIQYDDKSSYKRLKPTSKIILELNKNDFDNNRVYYPVYPIDDVNIPIIAAYYKVPTTTINDYMYNKVTSHLYNNKNINKNNSTRFTDINKLIKNTRPSIETIIENIPDSFDLNYNDLNNIFNRFGYSMDFINENDFELLIKHMNKLVKNEKERINVYKPLKNKKIDILNNKLTFFDKLSKTISLLNLTDKTKELLILLKSGLEDKRINSNLLQKPKLLYDNIDDIIKNISNDNVNIEQVIENIKSFKEFENIEKNITSINNYIETTQNLEEILEELENMKDDFNYIKYNIKNYDDNVNKKVFINFYNEMKEIVIGNNEDNYEGLPSILRNVDLENYEELEFDNEYVEEENNVVLSDSKMINNLLEKYWLTLEYKNDIGFIEILKIVLPILYIISKTSGIEINYEILCNELYIYFRGVSTKFNIIKRKLEEKQIYIDDNDIFDIAKIKAINTNLIDLNMGSGVNNIIKEANNEYSLIIEDVFNSSIAWWILNIQEKIIKDNFNIDNSKLNPIYIDKWFLYGEPLKKEKTKIGVAPYLISIIDDFIKEKNDNSINIVYDNIIELINDRYKDRLVILKNVYVDLESKKKIEYGVIAQKKMIENIKNKKFDKIAYDYIEALLYSPGVNYKKLHKYLLGCCLQKITKDFKPDSDLINNARRDLIDIKKKFATRKETNKKRSLRFTPIIKRESHEEYEDDEDIEYKKIENVETEIDEADILEWLDNMKEKNSLLPNNIIEDLKKNTRSSLDYIEKYIKILQKTSKKNSDLLEIFIPSNINYKTLLLNIIKIINIKTGDENTDLLLKKAIESIREILVDLEKLNMIKTEENRNDIERINAYIVARAMCLPCNPENTAGNILIPVIEVKINFIEDNAYRIYDKISSSIKNSKFLSFDENTAFINSMREKNKQIKLSILNNKTVEENNLISQLKKAGIKNNLMSVEMVNEKQEENLEEDNEAEKHFKEVEEEYLALQQDIYAQQDEDNAEGENEYAMGAEDDDGDDDNLDRNDMGFIYAD